MLMINIHGLPYWTPVLDFAVEREVQRKADGLSPQVGSSEEGETSSWDTVLLESSCVSGSLVEPGSGEKEERSEREGRGKGGLSLTGCKTPNSTGWNTWKRVGRLRTESHSARYLWGHG